MTNISIKADAVLKKACQILADAKSIQNITTPKYVKSDFKYDIQTKHTKVLNAFGISLDTFGTLFGNKTRWDADLCRYFTLNFIQFFISQTGKTDAVDVLQFYTGDSELQYLGIPLLEYTNAEFSEGSAYSAPTLFVADPRVISMKAYVLYPNTTLSRRFGGGFESKKWVNMRYLLEAEVPKISKIPAFTYDAVAGKVIPRISETPGFLIKFSYCELASYLKLLTYNCFQILDGQAPTHDMRIARKVLDIVNLITKGQYVFEISPYVPKKTPAPAAYRINPAPQRIYIRFPSMKNNEAFLVERLHLEAVSLYDLVPEDSSEISAKLFTTDDEPRVEVGPYVQWDVSPHIEEVDQLDEAEVLEIFSSLHI